MMMIEWFEERRKEEEEREGEEIKTCKVLINLSLSLLFLVLQYWIDRVEMREEEGGGGEGGGLTYWP